MKVTNDNFPGIYEELKKSIYSVSYNYLQNSEDASDVMQDTFIKLLKGDYEFSNMEHLKAWLIRVCINACKNYLRDHKTHKELELVEETPYYDKEVDDTVLKAVLELPEKYRIPIHLFYYEEYSVSEIAEALGMPESTTKSRLKRGRDILKKRLDKEI